MNEPMRQEIRNMVRRRTAVQVASPLAVAAAARLPLRRRWTVTYPLSASAVD